MCAHMMQGGADAMVDGSVRLTPRHRKQGRHIHKMNIDTDTQWSYWDGIRGYEAKYREYLQTQIGNPEGDDKPNKKFYDPRMSVRAAEDSTVQRLMQCFEDLQCVGRLGLGDAPEPSNILGPRRGALPV